MDWPGAQKVLDYRLMFYADDGYIGTHHFPIIPRIGEQWLIPAASYDDRGRTVALKILDVLYLWEGVRHDNVYGGTYLAGWYVEVRIRCEIIDEDPCPGTTAMLEYDSWPNRFPSALSARPI